MRNNKLTYVMESMMNGQKEQAVEFILRGCKSRPGKLINNFLTLIKTSASAKDTVEVYMLMEAVAKELEK